VASSLLSSLYGVGVGLRNRAYDWGLLSSERSPLKVICVGNITTGGSGKSPITQAIAALLTSSGQRPAILLRGYRGREPGPLLVGAEHTPADVGDEACMHRDALPGIPVVVSRNRVRGAELIESEKLGKVIILDDGYQHRALARNVNLLLFDEKGLEEAERGELLPTGNLREPRDSALQRANGVLLIERGRELSRPAWFPSRIPAFRIPFSLTTFTELAGGAPVAIDQLRTSELSAVASIARPAQFIEMLEAHGLKIAAQLIGRDHERWDEGTVERLNSLPGELVVTTAKDAVKFSSLSGIRKKVVVARLNAELPATFSQWLLTILS